jgi:hypothetical protein
VAEPISAHGIIVASGARAVRWITTQRDIAAPRAAGSICGIYCLRAI